MEVPAGGEIWKIKKQRSGFRSMSRGPNWTMAQRSGKAAAGPEAARYASMQACRAFRCPRAENSGEGGGEANHPIHARTEVKSSCSGGWASWNRHNAMEKLQDPRQSKADWFGGDMTLVARMDGRRRVGLVANHGPSIPPSATTTSDLELAQPPSITG